MNGYISRSELSRADRAGLRSPSAVPAVQPVSSQRGVGSQARKPNKGKRDADLSEDDLASAAEYARMYPRVADILAELRSSGHTPSIEDAEAEIQAMLPAPIILVPLPPASKEAVESAVALGRRIAEQASRAHAAQAHLRHGTVDQLLSADM